MASTVPQYPTESHYPVTEPTSPGPILTGSSVVQLCTGIMVVNGGEDDSYYIFSKACISNFLNGSNVLSTINNIIIMSYYIYLRSDRRSH